MIVERKQHGDFVVYHLSGSLDAVTAGGLEEAFNSQFDSGTKGYVLDMKSLEYISSAGLRTVLSCRNRAESDNIPFSICDLSKTVKKVFSIAGFSSILDLDLTFKEGSILKLS